MEANQESMATRTVPASLLSAAASEMLERLSERFLRAPMRRGAGGQPLAELDVQVSKEEVFEVCGWAVEAFKQQPALLRINLDLLPLTIVGDIHGQLRDVRLIFERMGEVGRHSYLFLGDYADRGVQGVEVLMFLMVCALRFPSKCFLLRGNHEDYNTSMIYGLLDECIAKYGMEGGQRVWLSLVNVFNHLPFSALIGGKIFATHGGLSPDLQVVEDVNKIVRPCLIPLYGLACDLVWADPSAMYEGWALSGRGISFSFGDQVSERFCQRNGIDLIVRGHQISSDFHSTGYKFSGNQRVLTLFTAADYQHSQNTGAVLTVYPNLRLQFTLFRPCTQQQLRKKTSVRVGRSRSAIGRPLGAAGGSSPLSASSSSRR